MLVFTAVINKSTLGVAGKRITSASHAHRPINVPNFSGCLSLRLQLDDSLESPRGVLFYTQQHQKNGNGNVNTYEETDPIQQYQDAVTVDSARHLKDSQQKINESFRHFKTKTLNPTKDSDISKMQINSNSNSNSNSSTTTVEIPSNLYDNSKDHYRPPTAPTGVPLAKILSNAFPLSYYDSYTEWKHTDPIKAEHQLLSLLNFYPINDGNSIGKSLKIQINKNDKNSKPLYINEFLIESLRKDKNVKTRDLIILHGYGAGLGFFYKNLEELSKKKNWRIHALDLLGYGNSSRPKFEIPINLKNNSEKTKYAINWFIDSFEKWRKERKIENFTIIAHSLGGYLSSHYTIKYPGFVNKLLLISPAAVPDPSTTNLKVPTWFNFLWEQNFSPFSLVRNTGPLGPMFTSGWTSRRFSHLKNNEMNALHNYSYNIFKAPGSGEYALNYLLGPGATARLPLVKFADQITCPTVWCYGDRDWMDVNGGIDSIKAITKKGIYDSKLKIIENSGHHLYLDNYESFNEFIMDEIKEVEEKDL